MGILTKLELDYEIDDIEKILQFLEPCAIGLNL